MQAHEMLRAQRLKVEGRRQEDAAAHCGVSLSAYEKWERGDKIMPPVMAGLMVMLGASAADALRAAGKVMRQN